MSKTVGLDIDFIYFLVFTPITMIVSMIPITFRGVGLRELSSVYMFSLIGAPPEKIVFVSLLTFLINIVLGIIGGIIYVFDSDLSRCKKEKVD